MLLVVIGIAWIWQDNRIGEPAENPLADMMWMETLSSEPIDPIPAVEALERGKVELGARLFHDVALSRDGTWSCATCHGLGSGGTDHLPHPVLVKGGHGNYNTPTVFNSGMNYRQFWDGRAVSLEDQMDDHFRKEGMMGVGWNEVVARLRADARYVASFKALYRNGVQAESIRDAIAVFERSLTTPNSRFDRYLRGDKNALTAVERQGYQLFKNYGCVSCHHGRLVGGNMMEEIGERRDYFKDRGFEKDIDLGRYNQTGIERDKYHFKVPGLRNVALTAPYFHDGSVATLEQAVVLMGRYQLGVELPAEHLDAIVAFLNTLTGEYGGKPL
ncbi:MAG: cytochrome c peroxidase [Pseudomonadota bacterium]